MRVFNAIFASLTTLLVAAVIIVSAGAFIGPRGATASQTAQATAPHETLVVERPRTHGSPLSTISPCLEPPTALARLR